MEVLEESFMTQFISFLIIGDSWTWRHDKSICKEVYTRSQSLPKILNFGLFFSKSFRKYLRFWLFLQLLLHNFFKSTSQSLSRLKIRIFSLRQKSYLNHFTKICQRSGRCWKVTRRFIQLDKKWIKTQNCKMIRFDYQSHIVVTNFKKFLSLNVHFLCRVFQNTQKSTLVKWAKLERLHAGRQNLIIRQVTVENYVNKLNKTRLVPYTQYRITSRRLYGCTMKKFSYDHSRIILL